MAVRLSLEKSESMALAVDDDVVGVETGAGMGREGIDGVGSGSVLHVLCLAAFVNTRMSS